MGNVDDIISPELVDGANRLLDDYLGIHPGDRLLIAYTPDSRRYAAMLSACCELRRIQVSCLPMRPVEDPDIGERLERWSRGLDSPTQGQTTHVLTLEKDTMSHQASFDALKSRWGRNRLRLTRAISVCDAFFATAMSVSPDRLSSRNSHVLAFCWGRRNLRVTTQGGTDLEITFDSDVYDWINNRGQSRAAGTTILPAGEVATYPVAINGRLVADFAYNINAINRLDSRLVSTPITVEIKDGQAVDYACASDEILRFLDSCFAHHNARHVGEVGFGTHPAVTAPIFMNSHINERSPGIHIGFGQHNQLEADPGYQALIHLDLIARGATLNAGGEELDLLKLPEGGDIREFRARDEDVFSPDFEDLDVEDCCGMLNSDGLTLFQTPG